MLVHNNPNVNEYDERERARACAMARRVQKSQEANGKIKTEKKFNVLINEFHRFSFN